MSGSDDYDDYDDDDDDDDDDDGRNRRYHVGSVFGDGNTTGG